MNAVRSIPAIVYTHRDAGRPAFVDHYLSLEPRPNTSPGTCGPVRCNRPYDSTRYGQSPARRDSDCDHPGTERRQRLYVDFSLLAGGRTKNRHFDTIHRAVEQSRLLKIDYVNSKLERTTRTVEPMTLVFRWRSWYLYAFCLLRKDFRLFRMSRIENPVFLDRRFVRRDRPVDRFLEELDHSGRLKGVELVLKFDKRIASVVKDMFEDAICEEGKNGDYIVQTMMPEDGWLYGFLLSFGVFLEIQKPARLRRLIAAEAKKIAALYASDQ